MSSQLILSIQGTLTNDLLDMSSSSRNIEYFLEEHVKLLGKAATTTLLPNMKRE